MDRVYIDRYIDNVIVLKNKSYFNENLIFTSRLFLFSMLVKLYVINLQQLIFNT